MANEGLKLDVFFSFSGIITFKKSQDIREIAKNIPNNKILIETDSPYLTPTPFRGKRNHPAFVKYVAEKLSEIKDIPFSELTDFTRNNTINFFDLK